MPPKKLIAPLFRDSDEAAIGLARYGSLEREITRIENELAEKVAGLREKADTQLAPLQTELTTTLLGLEAFAKRLRLTLPIGQKTIRLSAGDLGWRIGNPTVFLKGKVDVIITRIKAISSAHTKKYVRTKESLNRPALLQDRPQIDGIKYTLGKERFYVTARSEVSETKAVIETA